MAITTRKRVQNICFAMCAVFLIPLRYSQFFCVQIFADVEKKKQKKSEEKEKNPEKRKKK